MLSSCSIVADSVCELMTILFGNYQAADDHSIW